MEQPKLLGKALLDRFPGLSSAVINGVSTILFHMTSITPTLTELIIDNTKHVSIMSILVGCSKLETLKIKNTFILGDSAPVIAPSLKYLELDSTEGDDWMIQASFPKLETLVLRIPATPAILAFISANRSIKSLAYRGSIGDIASIAPQLLELNARPLLQALCATSPSSQMVFPDLRTLLVDMSSPIYEMTVDEFDMFVRTRCLYVGHPKGLANQRSQVLSNVVFLLPASSRPQEWQSSELYKESTRKESIHVLPGKKVLHLAWPVHKN